jgi:alpha-1,3-mannosyltransferase
MNILHISRQFLPFIGGTERYIYEVAKRLVKYNVKCKVLTLNYNLFDKTKKFKSYEIIGDIEVYRIPGFGYYKKPIPLSLPVKLFKWADIIHIHDLRFLYEATLLYKPFFKYKIVWSTHGFLLHTNDLSKLKSIIVPIYYKTTIEKFIDAIICVSKQDYEYFKKWDTKNLNLVENGIDFEKFSKVERKPEYGNFLYFGRIDTNKGLDLLFKALYIIKNKNWQLNVVGSGFKEIITNLKSLAESLGISKKIVWHGNVEDEKLLEFLSKSHLCFFPSTYEGFGITLIEAMAAGCICVANDILAYKSIVENNKNGFLVNFSFAEIVANKINELLSFPLNNFDNVSLSAKGKARSYDWENKILEIIDIYKKCYDSKS